MKQRIAGKVKKIDWKKVNRIIAEWSSAILQTLLVVALLAFCLYVALFRYKACMEVFDNFWYCVLR